MGVKTINNFDPDFEQPLDGRIVVAILSDLDDLVTNGQAYEGMLVYVKDTGFGEPGNYQYINIGVFPVVDIQWQVFSAGSGSILHNTLPDLQGGEPGEYYHLTHRQWQYLIGLVPFTAPTLNISTSAGPTWAYNVAVPTGIIISGTVVTNEGTNVMARLWDVAAGLPVILNQVGQNPQGYIPIVGSGVITGTFPINGNTVPVDTSQVNGDTAVYRLDVTYNDLNANPHTSSKNLVYVAQRRQVDEIWAYPKGWETLPVTLGPNLEIPPYPGALPAPVGQNVPCIKYTKNGAAAGMVIDLTIAPGPGYVVFMISDDLVDGDPTRIVLKQNGVVVYQEGSQNNQGWSIIPYNGSTIGSAGDPGLHFFQLGSTGKIGNIQTYVIEIV